MLRRLLALGGALVVLILIVLGVKGCLDARARGALSDYARNVEQIVNETNQTSKDFFSKLEDPGNLSVLIETDGSFPMMKNLTLDDFGVDVTDFYLDAYSYVTDDNTKVSSFGWVNNDNALAPGINDSFYALSQSLFSNTDVAAQLAQLDTDWDAAAGN